ncbi:hypothetical protein C8J57DRAFT_1622432 [Mycena rebaudengoi]|nr:hypothetical protein C8J57DRAFT_1622432 [Mycena rebaudengoi]
MFTPFLYHLASSVCHAAAAIAISNAPSLYVAWWPGSLVGHATPSYGAGLYRILSILSLIHVPIMHACRAGSLPRDVCITMLFILDVAYPNRFYWLPFYQLVGKLYVNSILTSLNIRTSVRGKGQLEVSTGSVLQAMEFASGSDSTPHPDSKTTNSGAGSGKGFQVQLRMMDSMHSEANRDVGIKSFLSDPTLAFGQFNQ